MSEIKDILEQLKRINEASPEGINWSTKIADILRGLNESKEGFLVLRNTTSNFAQIRAAISLFNAGIIILDRSETKGLVCKFPNGSKIDDGAIRILDAFSNAAVNLGHRKGQKRALGVMLALMEGKDFKIGQLNEKINDSSYSGVRNALIVLEEMGVAGGWKRKYNLNMDQLERIAQQN